MPELRRLIAELEGRLEKHAEILGEVIEAIQALSAPALTQAIGFRAPSANSEAQPGGDEGRGS